MKRELFNMLKIEEKQCFRTNLGRVPEIDPSGGSNIFGEESASHHTGGFPGIFLIELDTHLLKTFGDDRFIVGRAHPPA